MRWQAHVPLSAVRRTGGNDIHIDILIQLNLNVADATSRKRVILRSLVITSERDGSVGPSRNTWNDVEMLIVPASTWGWGLWEQDGDSMDASCFVVSVLQKNSTRVRRKGEWTDDEILFSERKGGLKIPANILKHFFFIWMIGLKCEKESIYSWERRGLNEGNEDESLVAKLTNKKQSWRNGGGWLEEKFRGNPAWRLGKSGIAMGKRVCREMTEILFCSSFL